MERPSTKSTTITTTIIACILTGISFLPAIAYAAEANSNAHKEKACPMLDQHQVALLFDRWNDSLKTLDPEKVVANYDKDAVLLATLSNTPRTNHAEMIAYFKDFLQNKPVGKIDKRVIRFGHDWATDTGLYTFSFTQNGKTKDVELCYFFFYEFIECRCLIIKKHSSLMPKAKKNKKKNPANS